MNSGEARMSSESYLALDGDGRAMARCFVKLDALPIEALEDMRSISIMGQSLARQIVDRSRHENFRYTITDFEIREAERVVERYESRTGPVPDPYDPLKDVCKNCNRPRSEHKMTRGGPVCPSGRRFLADSEHTHPRDIVTDSAGVTCRYTPIEELRSGDVVCLGWRSTVERVEIDKKEGQARVVWQNWSHPDQWNPLGTLMPVEVTD